MDQSGQCRRLSRLKYLVKVLSRIFPYRAKNHAKLTYKIQVPIDYFFLLTMHYERQVNGRFKGRSHMG
jgi:hypothetical protein